MAYLTWKQTQWAVLQLHAGKMRPPNLILTKCPKQTPKKCLANHHQLINLWWTHQEFMSQIGFIQFENSGPRQALDLCQQLYVNLSSAEVEVHLSGFYEPMRGSTFSIMAGWKSGSTDNEWTSKYLRLSSSFHLPPPAIPCVQADLGRSNKDPTLPPPASAHLSLSSPPRSYNLKLF